ncbi:MAG: hypothetical protein ABI142_07570, partial [Bryocella sp.]
GRLQIRASALPIQSVKDFRVVQTLSSLSLMATSRGSGSSGDGIVSKLPKYSFRAGHGSHITNGYLEMPDFTITKVG